MPFLGTNGAEAYGANARRLLKPLHPGLAELTRNTTEQFYEYIHNSPKAAAIFDNLRSDEFRRLVMQQEKHLALLLSADLTQSEHAEAAERAGHAHSLVGVDFLLLVEAYDVYQEELYKALSERIPNPGELEPLMRVISKRILLDIEGQVKTYHRVSAAIRSAFIQIDLHAKSTANLTDLIHDALEIICGIPGGICGLFARVDEQGELQIEQSHGENAEHYHRAMDGGTIPRISIDPKVEAGRGPGGRAWRSGEIVISDAWLVESDKAPWHSVGEQLGFRASASVPLFDESGHTIALLALYSQWPGFFSTDNIRGFLSHIQNILSYAVQKLMASPVIPLREQQTYRSILQQKRVIIHYQPIIDLKTGGLAKIEALARMRDGEGKFISPMRFLPAMGKEELLMLFRQGLMKACEDSLKLKKQKIETQVAINFPAEGFDDPRYEESFFDILDAFRLQPGEFQLEVLETNESSERTPSGKAFIRNLKNAGVQIAQDDLGSGHSSLLRMDQYPFDEVKIDQALVRSALRNPRNAVQFILYLTRLAHAFDIPVTVEGLENAGMIEAAAILGADRGQGFGIARPMPIEQIPEWHRNFRYRLDVSRPRTAIGAMAGYLLWDLQIATISERPELVAEFVSAKAIVDHFIETNNLQGSSIDELMKHNYELASSEKHSPMDASAARDNLLKELTQYWIKETHDTPE